MYSFLRPWIVLAEIGSFNEPARYLCVSDKGAKPVRGFSCHHGRQRVKLCLIFRDEGL